MWNHVSSEYKCENSNHHCRNEIGSHQSIETDSTGKYRNDFRIICHFGSEENNRDEGK
jgi:hypothetical protein